MVVEMEISREWENSGAGRSCVCAVPRPGREKKKSGRVQVFSSISIRAYTLRHTARLENKPDDDKSLRPARQRT